eukprot:gene37659-49317_t
MGQRDVGRGSEKHLGCPLCHCGGEGIEGIGVRGGMHGGMHGVCEYPFWGVLEIEVRIADMGECGLVSRTGAKGECEGFVGVGSGIGFWEALQHGGDGDPKADADEIGRRRQDDVCRDAAGFAIGGHRVGLGLAILVCTGKAEFRKRAVRQGEKRDFGRCQRGDGRHRRTVREAEQNERDDADNAYRSIKPGPD